MIFNITATQNTLKRYFFFETMCEGCLSAPIIIKSQIGAADILSNLPHNADYVVFLFLYYKSKAFDLPAMLNTGGHNIDSRGVNAAMT